MELNSIALLSNFERPSIDPPSPNWLGLQSTKESIRESGLWNTDHVEKFHDPAFLEKLKAYVGGSLRGILLYHVRQSGHKGSQRLWNAPAELNPPSSQILENRLPDL